jgi:hypothetical protein
VHNFRILFAALLTLLFVIDDDVVVVAAELSAEFLEDADAVTTATLDGDGSAASKTMASSLLLRSSEEAGTLLLPLPSAFIVAFLPSASIFWHGTSLHFFFVDYV